MNYSHFLFFYLFFSCIAFAQKGSWQIQLEKKLQSTSSQEERLVLSSAISQEIKEYNISEAQKLAENALAQSKKIASEYAEGEAYLALAELKRIRGRPWEALPFHEKALTIFQNLRKEAAIQRTLRDRAFAYSTLSKFDSAQIVLKKTTQWFEKNLANSREHGLCLFYWGINSIRLGDYREAMQHTQKAYKIFEEINDTYYQARATNNIGLIQRNMGYYKEGLESFSEALKNFEKIGKNTKGTSIVMINLGNTYLTFPDKNYQKQIIKYFENAYQIAQNIQDTMQMVSCLEALSKGENYAKNSEKAIKYNDIGLKLIQQTQNHIEEGYYILRTADIYVKEGGIEKVVEIIKKALQTFETQKVWGAVAQAQVRLARLYAQKKEYQTSQEYAKQVLINSEKSHDTSMLPHLYNLLLSNAIELKNFDEAEKWAKTAIQNYQKTKTRDMLLETYRHCIRMDTTLKNYGQASKWFVAYNNLRDSLSIENRNKDLMEMQFKYDMQDQKRENKYLKELNELNQLEAKERTIIITAVSTVLFIVFLVAILLYRNRQHLQRLLNMVNEKNQAIVEKNHEIEAKNNNLANLNLTKDRILSIISHDMRSPLSNLKAVLDLGNHGIITLEEQVEITQKLNKDISRVHDFLQNLLFWAESQMAGFKPATEIVNIPQSIEKIFDIVSPQAEKKKIELQNKIQAPLILKTDKDILDIVLLNLISNALKFTPEHGSITVYAIKEEPYITLAVQDTGVGIASQYQDKIFGSTRFTTNGTSDEKGTGFGLTLCRDFVEVLGGSIYFESKSREGTTFFVKLPHN